MWLEFTKLRASRAFIFTCLHFYVPYVHSFFYVPYMPSFFTYVPSFFYVSYVPSFFTCLTRLLFYVSYVSSFFTCLHFLRAYILFMYMLIKLTQMNLAMIAHCSALLLLNSIIYQCLSNVFTSVKPVSYSAWRFFFFEVKNINYF